MLLLVESTGAKRAAQAQLKRNLTGTLQRQGMRNIGFPSGNRNETVWSDGDDTLWCAFGSAEDEKIPRRWNVFGIFDGSASSLDISVEINIPTTGNSGRVAGFFARDAATGHVLLMHDGRIGGGRPGVGKEAFLAWSRAPLVPVTDGAGDIRHGIVVGHIEGEDLADRVWTYVRLVADFKARVKAGLVDDPAFRATLAAYSAFTDEFSGRKRGSRSSEIDYVSYHGDIVRHLHDDRCERAAKGERVLNSPLVDLFVETAAGITEVYEVKTAADRQTVYTGIGQLMTHTSGPPATAERYLVLPEGPDLQPDLERCLAENRISLLRYRLTGGRKPRVEMIA
jgi:hypothetical protein